MSGDGVFVCWNTTHGDTVEVYETTENRQRSPRHPVETSQAVRYRVRAANGEIVEQGSEGYTRREAAIGAAERHHPVVPGPQS